MKAVKCKGGVLSFISRQEAVLFNKADLNQFLDISTLNERDFHLAEELYKKNVFQKVQRESKIGYRIYPQKEKL